MFSSFKRKLKVVDVYPAFASFKKERFQYKNFTIFDIPEKNRIVFVFGGIDNPRNSISFDTLWKQFGGLIFVELDGNEFKVKNIRIALVKDLSHDIISVLVMNIKGINIVISGTWENMYSLVLDEEFFRSEASETESMENQVRDFKKSSVFDDFVYDLKHHSPSKDIFFSASRGHLYFWKLKIDGTMILQRDFDLSILGYILNTIEMKLDPQKILVLGENVEEESFYLCRLSESNNPVLPLEFEKRHILQKYDYVDTITCTSFVVQQSVTGKAIEYLVSISKKKKDEFYALSNGDSNLSFLMINEEKGEIELHKVFNCGRIRLCGSSQVFWRRDIICISNRFIFFAEEKEEKTTYDHANDSCVVNHRIVDVNRLFDSEKYNRKKDDGSIHHSENFLEDDEVVQTFRSDYDVGFIRKFSTSTSSKESLFFVEKLPDIDYGYEFGNIRKKKKEVKSDCIHISRFDLDSEMDILNSLDVVERTSFLREEFLCCEDSQIMKDLDFLKLCTGNTTFFLNVPKCFFV